MVESNTTTEYAFLLITDPHFRARNFFVRKDYVAESESIYNEIKDCVMRNLDLGRKVVLILMGDVFHDSFVDIESALHWNNKIMELVYLCHEVFLLVGNHEFTYSKDNPIWSMVKDVESQKLVSAVTKKSWAAKGSTNFIRIVDALEFGDLRFYFNHYGTKISQPALDGKTNVGLFHIDLYSRQMVEDAKVNFGIDIYEHTPVYFDGDVPVLEGYNYAVFGHNHLTYGMWKFSHPLTNSECILMNLASLGRTNHREVNNQFLERDIPVFVVRDGKFQGVEHNLITLWDRESSVIETRVKSEQEKRKVQKDNKENREYIKYVDDPIENLKMRVKNLGGGLHLRIIENALTNNHEKFELELIKGAVNK